MSQSEPPPSIDHKRWEFEQKRAMAEREHDRQEEAFQRMNESAINASHTALRTILLINGGAAVALLSLDGRLPPPQAKAVAATLIWFAFGIVAVTVAMAVTYFTHYSMAGVLASRKRTYEHPFVSSGSTTFRWILQKRVLHLLAAVAAAASLALFVKGMFAVRCALLV